MSDAPKIQQILKNFLSNAVKFTASGGVTVALPAPEPGPQALPVCIEVRDTGIGIPASKQSIIFEAFKQADGSTNRRYGGTGLGLNISRKLAQLLGGVIEVESQPDAGSSFRLKLPLEFSPAQSAEGFQAEADAPPEDEAGAPAADFNGRTILIVEHKLEHLLHLTPLLESWRFKVVGAQDLEEAVEALAEEPDCHTALIDLDMPLQEACDTLQKIHRALGPDGAVIGLAEDCPPASLPDCGNLSFKDCLALPVDAQHLLDSLSRHTEKP